MSKQYTVDELSKKIESIKSEREKTANALKKYEEELERRKQEAPLGVPSKLKSDVYYFLNSKNEVVYPTTLDNKWDGLSRQLACNVFDSYKSAEKHAEMLLTWRMALVAISKGEPIDIKVLLPLMKKGWVFYQGNINAWLWSDNKPTATNIRWEYEGEFYPIYGFNIKPADDWRESLRECGL